MSNQDKIKSNKKSSTRNNSYPRQEEFLYIRSLLNEINSKGKLSKHLIEELLPLLIKSLSNNHTLSPQKIQANAIPPGDVEEAFIKTVYDLRLRKKLTQKELSKKTKVHIARIESGTANVRLTTIYKICKGLDVSLTSFFSELNDKLPFIK